MHGHIQRLSLIRQSRQIRQKNQVPGRGNRQKLGNALNQSEDKQMGQGHEVPSAGEVPDGYKAFKTKGKDYFRSESVLK
jgi:hypothetical protein